MLPEIVEGTPLLVWAGVLFCPAKFFDDYFTYLQRKGLIRLKTSAEIIGERWPAPGA